VSEPTLVQTALQCDQPIKDSALCDRLGWVQEEILRSFRVYVIFRACPGNVVM